MVEFYGFISLYGPKGIITFIFQYIYYITESFLIYIIIAFGQKWGELRFNKHRIPWGGVICGITWDLVHILTKDITTGIFRLLISILYGITYLIMNKHFLLSFLFIALMFIL